MKKKILSIVIALVMIMATLPVAFASDEGTVITFSDTGISAGGSSDGIKISGTSLSIKESGTYTLKGTCSNGSVVVKKNITDVTIILDNLTLTSSATAAITCNKGSEVSIVAKQGTTNTLSDDKYNNDDVYTDESLYPNIENAVIKCKDGSNVTICGPGTINIDAYGKNGIKGGSDLYEEDESGNATSTLLSSASLTVKDVTLNINATVNDGLKSDKELNILSGNINISAADDAIKSDYTLNIGSEGTTGPTIKISKATEGIEGAVINVYSGNVYVNATDDGINAANGDIAERSEYFAYNQYGGYVYVNVTNGDGLDSNGSAMLSAGIIEIYAPSQGDGDPIDTEYGCTFGGATVLAVGHAMMQQAYNGAHVAFGSSGNMGGFGGMGSQTSIVSSKNTIVIYDNNGNAVYTAKSQVPRNASYVVFASSSITSGQTYSLNGSVSATAGTSNGGGMSNGGHGGFPGGQRPERNEENNQENNQENGLFSWFKNIIDKIVAFFKSLFD